MQGWLETLTYRRRALDEHDIGSVGIPIAAIVGPSEKGQATLSGRTTQGLKNATVFSSIDLATFATRSSPKATPPGNASIGAEAGQGA